MPFLVHNRNVFLLCVALSLSRTSLPCLYSHALALNPELSIGNTVDSVSSCLGRRDVLTTAAKTVASAAALAVMPSSVQAKEEETIEKLTNPSTSFAVYGVKSDSSAARNPTLERVQRPTFMETLSAIRSTTVVAPQGGAIWLGEHHNSAQDHQLQADLIQAIYETRLDWSERQKKSTPLPMAIGLEQVQVKFQPVLDDYVSGKITEGKMRERVEWNTRWAWPFDVYRPVFGLARELKIPLVALNVNSEDLAKVEKNGLPGLSNSELRAYIKDPSGFANFVKNEGYKEYVSYVIEPSYDMHKQMGLLTKTLSGETHETPMTFRNFLSGRMLWDEGMASAAHSWNLSNPGGLLVGLVGADHVKFRDGIPGRFARLAVGEGDMSCTSVMLNPTLIDSRPPGSVATVAGSASALFPDQITLQLRYLKEGVDRSAIDVSKQKFTGGVLPISDYIVVSG